MFLGDNGKPYQYHKLRINYDVVIDNENQTLQKLSKGLGFFTIVPEGKFKEVEVVYDTDKKLLSGAGLLLRKKMTPQRTYFSLVRISSIADGHSREKKSFLGDCEAGDQPSDFPVQIADGINKVFNNLFTVDVVEMVKHCTPYISIEILGNRYKIISGTGYSAYIQFEYLNARDARTGKKATIRNCSLSFELDPNYERERQKILDVIEHKCRELVPQNRNRFEIAQIAVRIPEPKEGEKKKSKKEIKAELKQKQAEENK